ncbi:MAG: hypothetical protein FJY85_25750 [Deltaproteobacteria bacterium]|nr:hypothetical protein [Deltaproteobacteria bacterium]
MERKQKVMQDSIDNGNQEYRNLIKDLYEKWTEWDAKAFNGFFSEKKEYLLMLPIFRAGMRVVSMARPVRRRRNCGLAGRVGVHDAVDDPDGSFEQKIWNEQNARSQGVFLLDQAGPVR